MILPLLLLVSAPAVGVDAKTENAPIVEHVQIDTSRQLLAGAEHELKSSILPFWLKYARDKERGGFYGTVNKDLTVEKDAPRGALLSARILWAFSAAYRHYPEPEYLEMARWAYKDLTSTFTDEKFGGLYWMLSADGKLMDARKVVYVQSFGIYALSEYYRATGEQAALDKAVEIYRMLEEHCHDHANQGYFEECTRDWQISRTRGKFLSSMGSRGQKSQNVHLHILEAYTNLYRVWPDEGLRKNLFELEDVMLNKILNSSNMHLHMFMGEDWTPGSDTISFGHDIEFSWLLVEAAEALGDEALIERAKKVAVEVVRITDEQGVDADGGVLGEADPDGLTVTDKEWWPQAEALIGFMNAYQISGDARYLTCTTRTWDFIQGHLVDHKDGGWFHSLSRDLIPDGAPKISFWKCPYHNSRACMELIDRLTSMLPESGK